MNYKDTDIKVLREFQLPVANIEYHDSSETFPSIPIPIKREQISSHLIWSRQSKPVGDGDWLWLMNQRSNCIEVDYSQFPLRLCMQLMQMRASERRVLANNTLGVEYNSTGLTSKWVDHHIWKKIEFFSLSFKQTSLSNSSSGRCWTFISRRVQQAGRQLGENNKMETTTTTNK